MTKKISQLPAATSVDTNDEFVINQDGTTKKLTTANPWQFSDVNIDGGNIDGTAIGASSASSGAFTTLTASDDVNFDSGTLFVDASANNVGIGTTSPNGTLVVRNGASSSEQLIVGNNSNTGGRDWRIGRDNVATGDLIIKNSDASDGNVTTERMRIDSSGHAIIPAGVTLGTSAGVYNAANTLDDYEEGTWTPVVADAEIGGNVATTSLARGTYVKVGKVVSIQYELANINTSGLTAGNQVYIRNLPFSTFTPILFSGHTGVSRVTFSGQMIYAFLNASSASISSFRLFTPSGTSAAHSAVIVSNINSGSNEIFGSFTYRTAN